MWLNQTVQSQNKTTLSVANSKLDCAKECPCGVPTIPVPDQWLEVMVTGGFKVWHIIFIIIAFIVTMIVIYCCIHRCRIPRTKQEIEADLMRSNLGNKFRDYLEELPSEPFTFTEALKKVQEIEEKLEQDDAQLSREIGARKRMGWIKLKGKEKEADKDIDKEKEKEADKKSNGRQDDEAGDLEVSSKVNGPQLADTALASPAAEVTNKSKEYSGGQSKQSDTEMPVTLEATKTERPTEKLETDNTGDKLPTKTTNTRRRRQKPNLSRTKLAKERPLLVESSDNFEKAIEPNPHLELPQPKTRRQHPNSVHKKKLKPVKNELGDRSALCPQSEDS